MAPMNVLGPEKKVRFLLLRISWLVKSKGHLHGPFDPFWHFMHFHESGVFCPFELITLFTTFFSKDSYSWNWRKSTVEFCAKSPDISGTTVAGLVAGLNACQTRQHRLPDLLF